MYIFQSERLGFREWKDTDILPFSQMNQDPDVMEFFPRTLSLEESAERILNFKEYFERDGYGIYVVELLETKEFIGIIGFLRPTFKVNFTPCIEIGWRLRKSMWNKGYATEAGKRCLEYGFTTLGFTEVFSFTAVLNTKSKRIMQKIGMSKFGEFEHPLLQNGSPLKTHVVYKIVCN